jgi:2-polyprenyl-6-methoxyphenol hydroxylase-like FAD-dependent oxidoreductase
VSGGGGRRYDAVVVGARCAGAPLAARLAEQGRSVLLVDREPPPADTLSTHAVFPNTVARLDELGALRRIEAEHRLNPMEYAATILGHEVTGPFTPVGGFDHMLCVTRPVLDQALLDVALEAGAETRFGVKVAGLLGAGRDGDPVRGVVLEDGEKIEAEWVFGADGRASTVASALGLEKERPEAGGMGLMLGYWRGVPATTQSFRLEVLADSALTWAACEDDVTMLILGVRPEETRGNAEQRQAKFIERLGDFSSWFDRGWLEDAEQLGGIRVAPETMLRGFFRRAAGPGWALLGDSGHFKHPSTGQGISDAIEQAFFVADALASGDGLEGYEAWRDERAREHYEWSFAYGRFPEPTVSDPLFAGLAGDPDAGRAFRDSFSRLTRPRSDVLTDERLGRWLSDGKTPVPSG